MSTNFASQQAGFIDFTRAPVRATVDGRPIERGRVRLRILLICLDLIGVFTAWSLVLAHTRHPTPHWLLSTLVFSLLTTVLIAAHHLYRARVCSIRSVEVGRLASSSLIIAFVATCYHETGGLGPSPTAAVLGAGLSFLLLAGLRTVYSAWLRTCRARGIFCRSICVLGTNDEAEFLVDLIQSEPEMGYRVVGVIGDPDEWGGRGIDVAAIDPAGDPVRAARDSGASSVLLATSSVEQLELDAVVRQLLGGGLHVEISSGLTRIGHQRVRANPLSHQLLFYVERSGLSSWQCILKRGLDVTLSAVMLIVSAPVIAAAAIAIKLEDRGPIFYRQERIGWLNKPFQLIKLRTMVPDASAHLAQVAKLNERSGPLFKLSHDPRVTKVGKLLRGTSLDELPQLLNVLKGEMSLVGPRPALESEVAKFDNELLERTSVRPGITGLWQVEARDSPSFYTYRRLDLFYVDNWSVILDLTILCATLVSVTARGLRAIRHGGERMGESIPARTDVSRPFDLQRLVRDAAPDVGWLDGSGRSQHSPLTVDE